MHRLALTALLAAACAEETPAPYRDLSNTGSACLVSEGASDTGYGYGYTTEATLAAGPTAVAVVLDTCHSSSVEGENAACTATLEGTTVVVTSEGGYTPPVGTQNDDCNMLKAVCTGPDLAEGAYTLSYGGQTVAFDVPATPPPCVGTR